MKSQITLLSLATVLGLSSCGITELLDGRTDANRIERGMSREQVQSLLGRPYSRSLGYNGEEIWEYRRGGELFDNGRVIIITFYDGRVVRMDNYRADERDRRESYPNYPNYPSRRDYPDYGESRRRISEESFQQILYGLQRRPFKDEQLRYIRDVAQRNRFTVRQAERLLRLFTWDDDKLRVLEPIAPGLVDPQEAYRLIELFTFDSGKRKARQLLGYRSYY